MVNALQPPNARISTLPTPLTGQQKAAIIVRLLQTEGEEFSLTDLSDNQQTNLVHQMADLSHIDQFTMTAVVEEFLSEFSRTGLSFPTSLADSVTLMENSVSQTTSRDIRHKAGLSLHPDPWAKLQAKEIDEILPLFSLESAEVGAVILSKLKAATVAEILGQIPGKKARQLTYALSLINNVPTGIVQSIGQSILEQLNTHTEREFDSGPVDRAGEILNFSAAAIRENLLEGLQMADADFAQEVRKVIFNFANIPERLSPRDVPRVIRDIDAADLITALVAAKLTDPEVGEFVVANLSQRMAEQLREEMDEKGDVKPTDGEAAMTTLVVAIRALADAGEIELIMPEE